MISVVVTAIVVGVPTAGGLVRHWMDLRFTQRLADKSPLDAEHLHGLAAILRAASGGLVDLLMRLIRRG